MGFRSEGLEQAPSTLPPAGGSVEVIGAPLLARRVPIELRESGSGRLRSIEAKGRAPGAETVPVARNEILTGLGVPHPFILATMEVADGVRHHRCTSGSPSRGSRTSGRRV